MCKIPDKIALVYDYLVYDESVVTALKSEFTVSLFYKDKYNLINIIKYKPKIILVDLDVPNVSWYKLGKTLKESHELSHIPIIYIVGLDLLVDDKTKLIIGDSEYVCKTPDIKQLLLRIKNTIAFINMRNQLFRANNELSEMHGKFKMLSSVINNCREGVIITTQEELIVSVNPAFCNITGYTQEEVLGKSPRIFKSQQHDKYFYKNMWDEITAYGFWRGEIMNRRKNGDVYQELLSISALKGSDGIVTHYVAIFTDITEHREKERQLEFLASYDSITGLPNRRLFTDNQAKVIERATRQNSKFAMLLFALDRFKDIHDLFGHSFRDDLLRQIASRISNRIRSTDSVCRLDGHEFCVILDEINDHYDAARVAADLIELMQIPFLVPETDSTVQVGSNIGISLFPTHSSSGQELLQQANSALNLAKTDGLNKFVFYSEEMTRLVRERIDSEAQLRRALENNELRVYYQPQLELGSGRIIGAEALVRWHHPKLGVILPDKFIPVAEKSGLIIQLGEWVLREACRQGVCWIIEGLPVIKIAVNLSPCQLRQKNILSTVASILQETGFPVDCLELEITETALMDQEVESFELLNHISEMGVLLALDDFGTGYSSLARMKQIPLHLLKIDRCFITEILNDKTDREITSTIITMGKSLGLKVLAEGVEQEEQLDFLRSLNCCYYQGYLASMPLSAMDFTALLYEKMEFSVAYEARVHLITE